MNYFSAFQISATGMAVERLRLDVAAVNLANMNSTAGANGRLFQPLQVAAHAMAPDFLQQFGARAGGAAVVGVVEAASAPRLVYEPSHPEADEKGFVRYPGVDHLSEMMTVMTALRCYEANVAAMNAAKTMATRALEIGGQ